MSKSGDINWQSNFRDAVGIVVNREVTAFKGNKAVWGFSQHIDLKEVTLLLKRRGVLTDSHTVFGQTVYSLSALA